MLFFRDGESKRHTQFSKSGTRLSTEYLLASPSIVSTWGFQVEVKERFYGANDVEYEVCLIK